MHWIYSGEDNTEGGEAQERGAEEAGGGGMHYRSMASWWCRVPFVLGAVLFFGEVKCDPIHATGHSESALLPLTIPRVEETKPTFGNLMTTYKEFAHAMASSSDDGLSPLQEWLAA